MWSQCKRFTFDGQRELKPESTGADRAAGAVPVPGATVYPLVSAFTRKTPDSRLGAHETVKRPCRSTDRRGRPPSGILCRRGRRPGSHGEPAALAARPPEREARNRVGGRRGEGRRAIGEAGRALAGRRTRGVREGGGRVRSPPIDLLPSPGRPPRGTAARSPPPAPPGRPPGAHPTRP